MAWRQGGQGGGQGGHGGGHGGQGGGNDDRQDRSVFVGNLAFRATEDEVGHAFSQFGDIVNIKFITDRETGRPRGFGFVEYSNPEAAAAAIQQMNGFEIQGRAIRVDKPGQRR